MVDLSLSAAWQFPLVVGLVDEVRVLVTLEMTLRVDLKCLGIIRWYIVFPTWCLFALFAPFRTEFCILLFLKGPSFVLSIMLLFGPDRTELPVFDVFGSFPVVADGSSWVCYSSSLMSTSPPVFSLLRLSLLCNLASSKLCTVGFGTGTFAEVTVFDAVCFF